MTRRSSVLIAALVALGLALALTTAAPAKTVTPTKTVSGVAKLKIGWVYTDEEYTGQHGGRLSVNWSSCVKAGGYYVDFPPGSHVLPFRDVPGPKTGSRMSLAAGHFVSQPYIGANAKPGPATIKLRCLKQSGKLLGIGKLKVQFVRAPITFSDNDIPVTLSLPYLAAGVPTDPSLGISLLACSEPGITTLTATSAAFAPDPNTGSRTVTLTRQFPTNLADDQYQGSITGATDTAPGDYPVSISCGSGVVGTGTITLHAAG